jgi:hypothetical protein
MTKREINLNDNVFTTELREDSPLPNTTKQKIKNIIKSLEEVHGVSPSVTRFSRGSAGVSVSNQLLSIIGELEKLVDDNEPK